ncbi:hypothetical protein [Butyrivibrio sp. AE3004]|uniref:hypothetical protein n=1 Tax=Butyrivibrio sp. AE3004 TaxID=1506994 RepID=UPI0004941F83|nr:hypothetical protein [Butyrivibrio sp. AE3004]
MLNLVPEIAEEYVTLKHSENIFHDALTEVQKGETHFHVTDPKGQVPDYNLEYIENMMMFPEQVRGLITKMTNGGAVYGRYLYYDETDIDNICLDFLKQFKKIEMEVVDEYSIGVTRIALEHTDIPVYFTDDRIKWFIGETNSLHIVDSLPEEPDKDTLRVIAGAFEMGYTKRDWHRVGSVAAFQNLFFWQAFTGGKKGPFKYIEVIMSQITGIGGLLSQISIVTHAGEPRGLQTFLRPGCTRYSEELLGKYFHINPKPADATEDNTLVLSDLYSVFSTSWYANQYPSNFDESILDEGFAAEMREYADAILGGRRVLGVLARGTDYVTLNLGGDRRHATPDQMISAIQDWMEEGKYDKIFLATEDKDNLDKIRAAFPGKVMAISQERHTVSEMQKKNSSIIYEFEQKLNTGKAYSDALEDTTVNYFYALYILARCDAFLCSGQCNGWDTVRALNGGKFEKARKLMVTFEGDPAVEKFKEIRPITAGMFARGAYPVGKAFFMTYRFDLRDKVDSDAIKSAWEKTLKVYPYLTYAVETRGGKLVFLENKLPFVIKETAEITEPFSRSGNFHTVTFCYMANTLWIYADHVPFDGTGFMHVLETFFYHYYCDADNHEYDVPEGVFTEKDGVVEGQEEDAYLMANPIDPKEVMGKMLGGKIFVAKETVQDDIFAQKENCRGYCISVPSGEMMKYTKSVKGSPMSVLSVLFAKAMERENPENKLPISMMTPISIRKVMGNENSLLHQVVHAYYEFKTDELSESDDETLNTKYRAFLKGYTGEENIRMLCGVYRGICEGYAKAFAAGALDNIILEQRSHMNGSFGVSYLGTLRTGDYGDKIRMTAFHAMQEKGIMLQTTEVGDHFYIDWYQGFPGERYAAAMRDLMLEAGMKNVTIERVE